MNNKEIAQWYSVQGQRRRYSFNSFSSKYPLHLLATRPMVHCDNAATIRRPNSFPTYTHTPRIHRTRAPVCSMLSELTHAPERFDESLFRFGKIGFYDFYRQLSNSCYCHVNLMFGRLDMASAYLVHMSFGREVINCYLLWGNYFGARATI